MIETFEQYQIAARRTQNNELRLFQKREHAKMGLVSEVGEITGLFQKTYQGHTFDESALKLEIGDCFWFLSELCDCYGWALDEVLQANVDKLKIRYPERFTPEKSINRIEYRDKTSGEKARHYAQGEGHRK